MNQEKKLVRILTCGSVDNGKSTLIGRLMLDAKALMEDQIVAVTKSQFSRGELNLAMFTDGLTEERERGITIDVAYRYFSTPTHKFILADCPGHAEYTRNMATGASNSDIALILVDPNYVLEHKQLEDQTKLHYRICQLFGLVTIFVINKADTIAWDYSQIAQVETVIDNFTEGLHHATVAVSALTGENVSEPRPNGGYRPSLIGLITHVADRLSTAPRTGGAVVSQLLSDCPSIGSVLSGALRVGEPVHVHGIVLHDKLIDPDSGWVSLEDIGATRVGATGVRLRDHVRGLEILGRKTDEVVAGDAIEVELCLHKFCDFLRPGYVITSTDVRVDFLSELPATIVWMSDTAAITEHPQYILKTELGSISAEVVAVDGLLDLVEGVFCSTLHYFPVANDIVKVQVKLGAELIVPVGDDPRSTPGRKFILIDKDSGDTVAAGFIN